MTPTHTDKEALRAANPIDAVIGETVELRKQGRLKKVGLCPFHDDHRPSLHVDTAKQRWYCSPCRVSGDVFEWIMRRDGVDFPEALRILARRAGLDLSIDHQPETGTLSNAEALEKLQTERCLDANTIDHFGIAPDSEKQAWTYPVKGGHRYKAYSGKAAEHKYWHTEGIRNQLYGIDSISAPTEWVLWVNGEPVVWQCYQARCPAVCGFGEGNVPPDAAEQLRAKGIKRVYVVADRGKKGTQLARRTAELLHAKGLEVWAIELPEDLGGDGTDLGDLYVRLEGHRPTFRQQVDALREAARMEARDTQETVNGGSFFGNFDSSPYPLHALPPLVREYVEQTAKARQVPPDFVAVPLLPFAAACIGNTASIRIKRGFEELPILWAAVVAPPGTGKSPAQDAARKPLDFLQAEAKKTYEARLAEHNANADGSPAVAKPRLEHFYSTDTTPEAIADILDGSAGLVLIRDELSGWVHGFDAYRKGGERQQHLSAWAGAPFKVDRKAKNQEPLFVREPVVCVAGGIQPDLVTELADDAARRDGFVERFLWSCPQASPSQWTDDEDDPELLERVTELFRNLRSSAKRQFTLSKDAHTIWRDWYNQNSAQAQGKTGILRGVIDKMPRQVARLALVLHLLEDPRSPLSAISSGTLLAAIELRDYHCQHAAKALACFSTQQGGGTRRGRLLSILRKESRWMSLTELHRALGNSVQGPNLRDELGKLHDRGLVGRREISSGAGRTREEWLAVPENGFAEDSEDSEFIKTPIPEERL